MPLHTLPVDVLERILDYIETQGLAALSCTCKSLHHPANRHLYNHDSDEGWTTRQKTLLERSLSLNPENAQLLRVYSATHIDDLKTLWSTTPLHLQKLSLPFAAFGDTLDRSWYELVSCVHPETRI